MKKNYKDIKVEYYNPIYRIPTALTHIIRQLMTVVLPGILTLVIICGLSFYLNMGFGLIMIFGIIVSILIMRTRFYTCKDLFYKRVKIFNKNNQDIQDKFLNLFNIFLSNQVDLESKDNLDRKHTLKTLGGMRCERGKNLNNTFLIYCFYIAFYYLIL